MEKFTSNLDQWIYLLYSKNITVFGIMVNLSY